MIHGHGDDIFDYAGTIRHNFSSNVYPPTALPGLQEHLARAISTIGHYPPAEATALERRLAQRLQCPQGGVLLTNGATEAIYLLAHAMGPGCRSAIVVPTFSEYEDACRLHGHEVRHLRSLRELTDDVQAVWLCCPNNPTGRLTPRSELVAAAFSHPHTVFIVDQSYAFFCLGDQLRPREGALMGNVVMLHSMTKRYAIPGMRLGFVAAPEALVDTLRRYRMPWSVNALAVEACRYILDHADEQAFDMEAYLHEAQRLRRNIIALGHGIEVPPTDTHFMLVRIPGCDALMVKRRLMDSAGILVRAAHNFTGLSPDHIRVAAQSAEANDRLVEAIKS